MAFSVVLTLALERSFDAIRAANQPWTDVTISDIFEPSIEHQPKTHYADPLAYKKSKQGKKRPASSLFLPPCIPHSKETWMECSLPNHQDQPTIDVILTVFKRKNLQAQLDMIAAQSLLPSHIWILQTENHQDVTSIIKRWNSTKQNSTTTTLPDPHLIHFVDSDSKYHGRFHIAYMMSVARYVSVWDDDLQVGSRWLEHAVGFLQSQNDIAIVSSGGRVVKELPAPANEWNVVYHDRGTATTLSPPVEWSGGTAHRVDFTVQHHTLRRELLRFYLGSLAHTYFTGEDIQVSRALQERGVSAYQLESNKREGRWASADFGMGANGPLASWKTKSQKPRLWLLCKVASSASEEQDEEVPMDFPHCSNCQNSTVIQHCVQHFEAMENTTRHRSRRRRLQQDEVSF